MMGATDTIIRVNASSAPKVIILIRISTANVMMISATNIYLTLVTVLDVSQAILLLESIVYTSTMIQSVLDTKMKDAFNAPKEQFSMIIKSV